MDYFSNRDLIRTSIYISPEWKSIGVFTSGGFDSSLLLYLLLLEKFRLKLKTEIKAIVINQPFTKNHSKRILQELNKHFSYIVEMEQIECLDEEIGRITETALALSEHTSHDALFSGVNSNPPPSLVKFDVEYPVRPKNSIYKKIIMPFLPLYKCDIVNIAHTAGFEFMMSLTHTCTTHFEGSCGKCFACLERNWAFQFNNLTDPKFDNKFSI